MSREEDVVAHEGSPCLLEIRKWHEPVSFCGACILAHCEVKAPLMSEVDVTLVVGAIIGEQLDETIAI